MARMSSEVSIESDDRELISVEHNCIIVLISMFTQSLKYGRLFLYLFDRMQR